MERLLYGNYEEFSDYLLQIRKESKSPPYAYLAKIQSESVNSNSSKKFLTSLLSKTNLSSDLRVIGPLPSIMEKKSGIYRWEISLLSDTRSSLHKNLDLIQQELKLVNKTSKARWSIEVDPSSNL